MTTRRTAPYIVISGVAAVGVAELAMAMPLAGFALLGFLIARGGAELPPPRDAPGYVALGSILYLVSGLVLAVSGATKLFVRRRARRRGPSLGLALLAILALLPTLSLFVPATRLFLENELMDLLLR